MEKDPLFDAADVAVEDALDPIILSIDVGTSSARALVYDSRGQMVRGWGMHAPYSLETTTDGGVFVDAEILFATVESCVDGILKMAGKEASRIAAVACDTFWHTLMGVDASGRALTPLYTWADTRSGSCVSYLRERLDETAAFDRTGVVFHSSYLPSKLLWLQQTTRDFESVPYWMSFGEYLFLRLFGERRISISMASGTGLLNQKSCTWDEEILAVLPIRIEQLSSIHDFSDAEGPLATEYKTRWKVLSDIPWYLPLGDGGCNSIGSGGISPECVIAMVGTSGAMRIVQDFERTRFMRGLSTYRIDRRRCVQVGALSDGGNELDWLKNLFQLDTSDLDARLREQEPDSHGLTVLPFLAGERSPDWNRGARATFFGMTLNTEGLDLVRASLEAIAYRFALVYALFREVIERPKGIIGSGAALLHSSAWMQILSDVLDEQLVMSAVPEASSRGAALLTLESMGVLSHLSDAPAPLGTKYEPQAKNTATYRAAIKRQQDLYNRLFGQQAETRRL